MVIVGGGAMGVSLLYHLCKRGWREVVLVEKNELTAGSTWHAAGLCTHFAHNATIMEMRARSVQLYRDVLPEETGLDTGFHASGALRVTRSHERMAEFRHVQGLGRFVRYDFQILSPRELQALYPLCVVDGLLGAIYEPNDGHVDPTLATNAMAAAARALGAEIYRHNPVRAIERTASGEWRVTTESGEVRAEHVVNAAGTWCREIGAMMGLDLPVVPMLHQYVVTDSVDEIATRIAQGLAELPIIRDPEESWYLRQERDGYIVGPYEKAAQTWSVDGVPPTFGMELLPPALDRIEAIMLLAMQRVPALASAGIKTIVNGPITFTPDANPLIGPAFGMRNAWLLTGSSMGVMEGGGAGAFLADWLVDGAPPGDALAIDARRFGNFADRSYRIVKAVECFGLQFGIHFPYEEREAGRPRRTTSIVQRQRDAGAVFGCVYGWERPNWFAPAERRDAPLTFRRPGWFSRVAAECHAVRDNVGIVDLSAFSKFEIHGADAAAFLEALGANRPPAAVGRIGLVHALTSAGGVASEFTITRIADDRFYLTSAAAAERHDEDLLRARAGALRLTIHNRTETMGVLGVMGPQSRTLLQSLSDSDFANAAFPWLTAQRVAIAGVAVHALRISYVGELGWELHADLAQLGALYDALEHAGRELELRPFGAYAVNSMRLEKGYRAWGLDLTTERTPLESGLSHVVDSGTRAFIGRDAMLARAADTRWQMVLLRIDAPDDLDPFYLHTVLQGDRPVGIVTSGGFGHRTRQRLALAYLRPQVATRDFTVDIVGERCAAHVLGRAPYDCDNDLLRGSERSIEGAALK